MSCVTDDCAVGVVGESGDPRLRRVFAALELLVAAEIESMNPSLS